MAASERLRMRHPVPGLRGGGLFVSELQRARLLDATFAVVYEHGFRGMAVRAVTERAGISTKTFYDLFTDREDCFLAAFDHGVDQLVTLVGAAHAAEEDWAAGMRAGLGTLLAFLDGEPALRMLVFVEALGAGPRVLARRAQVLQDLAAVIDEGRAGMKAGGELPSLTGEGIVGAAFGVIHLRLLQPQLGPLSGLLNDLMAMIVLPYRGRAAAARELSRPALNPTAVGDPGTGGGSRSGAARPLGSGPVVDFRLTVRTQTVLAVVAAHPGSNNRMVSELAGISDQGQISRLMMRLSEQGLLENIGGRGLGVPKAWHLTSDGEAVVQTNRPPVASRSSVSKAAR